MNKLTFCVWAAAAALCILVTVPVRAADAKVYELRIYTAAPGKLDGLLARFRDHTCKLFEKHGMENIGYWVPLDADKGADNTLIYIVAHQSRDVAKVSWGAFVKDPAWQAAAKKSEENGKLVAKIESIYITPTDFSPAVKLGAGSGPRVFELRDYTTPEEKVAALDARFRDHTMKLFAKQGMENLPYFHPADQAKGAGSRLIYLLAHKSKEAGLASFDAFRKDAAWIAAREASEKKAGGSLTVKDGVKSTYMRAVDFSPIR